MTCRRNAASVSPQKTVSYVLWRGVYLGQTNGQDGCQQHSNSRVMNDHVARYERWVMRPVSRCKRRGVKRALMEGARRFDKFGCSWGRQPINGSFMQRL